MSAATALSDLPPQPGPTAEAKPSRFAPILSLVRKLVDYGKQLAASLQQPTPTTDLDEVARTFGSYDFRQIIASVLRGLHRAAELEARLEHLDARPQPEPRPAALRAPRAPRAAASPAPRAPTAPAIPSYLLTPEQIAEQVRTRPIGAVLADICRDLGILPCHPLWRELSMAIMRFNGNLMRLYKDIDRRPWLDPDTRQPIPMPSLQLKPLFGLIPAPAGTGPPS